MNVTKIVVSSEGTVNLGNYQNWKPTLTLEAELSEGDNPEECITKLQKQADELLASHVLSVLMQDRPSVSARIGQQTSQLTKNHLMQVMTGLEWVNVLNPPAIPAEPIPDDCPF